MYVLVHCTMYITHTCTVQEGCVQAVRSDYLLRTDPFLRNQGKHTLINTRKVEFLLYVHKCTMKVSVQCGVFKQQREGPWIIYYV